MSKWWPRGRSLRVLLSVGIALAVAAGLLTAWQMAASRPGKLAVKVTGLPANSRFALHISGANGFSEELTSDKTLSVDPGDYRITAKASHAKGNVYYTADETTTWTVDGGETERAVIDYAVALSERTTVLSAPDSADSGLLKRPGTSELVFAAGSATARKLKKGDFVVAAESERTPRGLVREVRGVTREKDRIVVRTKDATLQQAMPKAVLRVEDPSDSARGTKTEMQPASYQMPQAPASSSPDPEGFQPEVSIGVDTWRGKGPLAKMKCSGSLALVKYEHGPLKFGMAGSDFGWNRQDGAWARMNVQVQQRHKLTLGSPVGASCGFDWEFAKFRVPHVTAKLLKVGYFNLDPEVAIYLNGKIKGDAGAKLEIESPLDYRGSTQLNLLRKPSAGATGWPPKATVKMPSAAGLGARAKLGVRISLKVSPVIEVLVAGIDLETALVFDGRIDVIHDSAKVKFLPEATVSMSLGPGNLGLDPNLPPPRSIDVSFPLAKPTTIWESAPGEVKAKVKKADPGKAVACPSRSWMKTELEAIAKYDTEAHLGQSTCWPGWAAVTWSDEPASDFVTISVFKRNARHFYPAVHLLPVMDDPYDPDWLRDCETLRRMKPPAALLSFVGCTGQPTVNQDKLDAAAALRLMKNANYTPEITADELGALPGPLRAVRAMCTGSYDGNCAAVFFFHGNRFVGQASGPGAMTIEAQDGRTVTLARPIFKDSDPSCCPSGGTARNQVRWSGGALASTPSLEDFTPHNEPVR
ncbi:LppP/LprE family lipoprotein [Streptomyces lonegramiae]|uniref:LppP/LprE family lipoprotein n=1 Tax=Streptomyces lonegramiae TaxID=3075524 RepID=A0ABU2X9B7_9ACTN|nr:LppP/LprE family lipoprotein [Streptomyces sp. DSM 41529]MDT0542499.1 LppP/LprE family lipoprotein [Streptomyces sp. DSM 41529]